MFQKEDEVVVHAIVEDDEHKIPVSHEVVFPSSSCHHATITAIAFDKHTNTQMATGSSGDYKIKLWDFTSMNKALRPYKEHIPFDGHPVRSLCFSPDKEAEQILICCGNS